MQRIEYGPDPSQFGELTWPPGAPRGVVVVVHGGFWKAAYDLALGRPLAADLADRDWVVWNVEYRRVGNGGGAPQTLQDLTAALERLRDPELDLDLSTVVGLGHSAGGHLATWAGGGGVLTQVISQAGVLDLESAHRDRLGDGAVEAFLGHPPGPADAAYDPIALAPLDIPVWCVHGRADDVVPLSQSEEYVDRVQAAGGRAELVVVEGDHDAVIDTGSAAWDRTVSILDLVG
ncbi:alpha/beta hydrolase family protein [Nocardioides pantholopis]|uniref:alpha/beta hydrolase family protein n=1 Tax=Nocardioides pantholopis TaxID=2483798 RepID=UPI000F09155D|nr:alpha/beta hydrolase [Nocardioides pantholopis]